MLVVCVTAIISNFLQGGICGLDNVILANVLNRYIRLQEYTAYTGAKQDGIDGVCNHSFRSFFDGLKTIETVPLLIFQELPA
jgi:hypothetical protein